MNRPLLIVVAGRPGSGKTTLAHALARAIRCPAICRDEIMEGLVNTTGDKGAPGDASVRKVYDAFFETVELLLRCDVTLVAEAAFQHKRWAPKLEPLREIARIRIVLCLIDPLLARARILRRGEENPERSRFHHDESALAAIDRETTALAPAVYDPPRLEVPTLVVDTSDGYRPVFEDVVAFARA